jgi:alkylation response protein AidB-like acyl-CoA dehydrogenase
VPDNFDIQKGYDFSVSESQEKLKQKVRGFASKYLKPHVMEWDEAQVFPIETFKKLGSDGFTGVSVPKEYKGLGLGYFEHVIAIIEIAKVCGAIALSVTAHSLCSEHILAFGNEEQKKKWLPKLATGEWIGAWGLTEANSGSDSLNMASVATTDGDHYIVKGTKNWVTNGKSADIVVAMVRTGEKKDPDGISAIVIEKGISGFSYGKKENKLGMRASETIELIFDNCRVPKENLLGNAGKGFEQAIKVLEGSRISMAALSLGIAQGAFEAAVTYSKQRRQFGQPISNFQAISFKLADLATEIEAAELLIMQVADRKNRGLNITRESSMAKYFASELAVKAATEAVQIFGGYGYSKDYPVEKFYRDAKLCTIEDGTSEIQKGIILKEILRAI